MRSRRSVCAEITVMLLLLIIACFAAPVRAADAAAGEVQYAARFADYTNLRDTGLRFGTSSWSGASMVLADGELRVGASSGEKTYLLLPTPETWTDTYTIVYTFRFADIAAANGYCGFLLTSRGDAPSNRTGLIIRANGMADGYTASPNEKLKTAAADGAPITVRITVKYNFLISFSIETGGEVVGAYKPSMLKSIGAGGRGFVMRNTSAAISSVMVVSGADYDQLSGSYAEQSYIAPPEWTMPALPAPPTGDAAGLCAAAVSASAAGIFLYRKTKRKN